MVYSFLGNGYKLFFDEVNAVSLLLSLKSLTLEGFLLLECHYCYCCSSRSRTTCVKRFGVEVEDWVVG